MVNVLRARNIGYQQDPFGYFCCFISFRPMKRWHLLQLDLDYCDVPRYDAIMQKLTIGEMCLPCDIEI